MITARQPILKAPQPHAIATTGGSGLPTLGRRGGVALRQLGAMINASVNEDAGAFQLKFVDVREAGRET